MPNPLRIILSGGGTGGHIFPAVSIAHEIKARYPEADIQFVGAQGRMEMERIPAAGYPIMGIPIAGFQRKALYKNLRLPLQILRSLGLVRQLLQRTKPHAVIGTGGYVSGPTLFMAQRQGIPTLIQEQNGFAGWTNRLVSRQAKAICTAYPNMERVFPPGQTIQTGNPVRPEIAAMAHGTPNSDDRASAKTALGFDPNRKLILILGGSQGARAINQAVEHAQTSWLDAGHQLLWQCGKFYFTDLNERIGSSADRQIAAFIDDMVMTYCAADLVVSRAGAGTLSELCCASAAAILIPSPNVAEDHQTHNALSLHDRDAALHLPENQAHELEGIVMDYLKHPEKMEGLRAGARALAQPRAAQDIVDQLEKHWSWSA
ncbi:MAG: undecaprenyldiphospho-muramoylpentapeptide beta-N-acetylglucosaminyltransferase [Schleiferiaceae bacterium]|nr:undecaprenyldiphospho-muramoylpentapeptide beta-N-acetylglucosaminyltransferase [Schleiferiaceae bacterium]